MSFSSVKIKICSKYQIFKIIIIFKTKIMRKTFNRRKDWFSEAKNDKNVNNKYKLVKENYGSKYCPKVSPIKKTGFK